MKISKKIFLFPALSLLFLSAAMPAQAENAYDKARDNLGKIGTETGIGQIINPDQGEVDIYTRLANYLNVLLGLLGIIASIYVIYGGYRWMRAGGNEQIVTEAKDTIRSAVIGLIVIFGSYALVNFVVLKLIGSI